MEPRELFVLASKRLMEAEMGGEFPDARIGNTGSSRLPGAAKHIVAIECLAAYLLVPLRSPQTLLVRHAASGRKRNPWIAPVKAIAWRLNPLLPSHRRN
jgi:hypothetical protein